MEQSILLSTKKILGIDPDYTAFDLDIMTHINAVFSTLHQLGVGPAAGFVIDDEIPVWTDFITVDDTVMLSQVKTYVSLKVRMLFDPPITSFTIAAIKEEITQLEWRLNVHREGSEWVDPSPIIVVDGGDPSGGIE